MEIDLSLFLEVTGLLLNLAYVILAARQNIWCWFFGIVGSAVSIYLFINARLYAESALFVYYIIMGFYGWYMWYKPGKSAEETGIIKVWSWSYHLIILFTGSALALILAWILQKYTNAEMSILDSFTTIFSFIATWMVAKKLLENWIYWIIINAATIFLYSSRSLYIYAFLSLIFTGMAIYGYYVWLKDYRKIKVQNAG